MQAERIAKLLPEVYQRTIVAGTPIATLLEVMAQMQDPIDDVLRQLPDYFDPQRTPDRFVPFLARWVDLARWLDDTSGGFDSGVGRLRQVVAAAAHLSRIRGTAQGLRESLEWATGVDGVRIDEEVPDASGRTRPFHVVVTLPKEASVHQRLVRRIVEQEKPAHVTAEIVFLNGPSESAGEAEEPAPPLTLPMSAPAVTTQPSFPGTEPAPVVSIAPDHVPGPAAVAAPAVPLPSVPGTTPVAPTPAATPMTGHRPAAPIPSPSPAPGPTVPATAPSPAAREEPTT